MGMYVVNQSSPLITQKARPTPSLLPLGEFLIALADPKSAGGGCSLVTGALLLVDGRPSVLAN